MTPLTKSVKRKALGRHRGRGFAVILEPGDIIGFRVERSRTVFYTTLAACFDMAVRQQVLADRAAKKAKRKKK